MLIIDLNKLNKSNLKSKSQNFTKPIYSLQYNSSEIWYEKVNVTFMYNSEVYETQKVRLNGYATTPKNPFVDGFMFIGWSVDGETIVDLSTYQITSDTTFVGIFASANILVKYNNTDTNFATFEQAMTYVLSLENGYNPIDIILFQDDTMSSSYYIDNENVTIDLNGHQLIGSNTITISSTSDYPTIVKDTSEEKTGYIKANNFIVRSLCRLKLVDISVELTTYSGYAIEVYGQATLNLNNVNIKSIGSSATTIGVTKTSSSYRGQCYITGGKVESAYRCIYATGGSVNTPVILDVDNVEFTTNNLGVGIYISTFVDLHIDNSIFDKCTRGITIMNDGSESSPYYSYHYITNCTFKNGVNTSTAWEGAAAVFGYGNYYHTYISGCTIENNTISRAGGAFFLLGGTMTISNTIIQNNTAQEGSAIYLSEGTMNLVDVNIQNNICTATTSGAIEFADNTYSKTLNLKSNTIVYNNYQDGKQRNIYINSTRYPNIYSNFVGTVGFTNVSGTGKVAQFAESTQPVGATYTSDEGYNVTISGNEILLS